MFKGGYCSSFHTSNLVTSIKLGYVRNSKGQFILDNTVIPSGKYWKCTYSGNANSFTKYKVTYWNPNIILFQVGKRYGGQLGSVWSYQDTYSPAKQKNTDLYLTIKGQKVSNYVKTIKVSNM